MEDKDVPPPYSPEQYTAAGSVPRRCSWLWLLRSTGSSSRRRLSLTAISHPTAPSWCTFQYTCNMATAAIWLPTAIWLPSTAIWLPTSSPTAWLKATAHQLCNQCRRQYTSLWGKQTVSKTFTNPSFSLKQVQPSDPFSQIKGNIARMDNHFTSLFQKCVLNWLHV